MRKSADRENDRMKALFERFEAPLPQFATRIIGDRDHARDAPFHPVVGKAQALRNG